MVDIGRNDPCPCGSGKKYKKCCQAKDEAKQRAVIEKEWTKSVKEFEQEKKEADKAEAENPSKAPKPVTHPTSSVKNLRHNAPTMPKTTMPRKSGGGA